MAIITPKTRNGSFSWQGVQNFAAGFSTESVYALTATGTNQATAALAGSGYTQFSTVPSGTGAILPAATVGGRWIIIENSGANALLVYPNLGAKIDGAAANAPYSVVPGSAVFFISSEYNAVSDSYNFQAVVTGSSGGSNNAEIVTVALPHQTETVVATSISSPVEIIPVASDNTSYLVPDIKWRESAGVIYVTADYSSQDQGIKLNSDTARPLTPNTFVRQLYDASPDYISSDTFSYDVGTGAITVSKTGRYFISAQDVIGQPTDVGVLQRQLIVDKNEGGGGAKILLWDISNKINIINAGWGTSVAGEFNLTAGDVITARVYHEETGVTNAESILRHLEVRFISPPPALTANISLLIADSAASGGGGGGGGVPASRTLTAGNGLTGGGDLSANRTFNVVGNVDGSIIANPDNVQVGVLATDAQHGVRGGGTQHAVATTSVAGFMSAADKVKADYWVNVLDYGADPTGVADSLAAFTAAMNAIPIGSRNFGILIPAGLYTLSGTWLINRAVHIKGGGNRNAANGGTQIQGRKGFDVIRFLYTNTVVSGGAANSVCEGFVVTHQSGTANWVSLAAGYIANQSAIVPSTGYAGTWESYSGFILRCIQSGNSGAVEPTWSTYGFGNNIARGDLVRAGSTVTAITGSAHGYITGNSVYIMSDDPAFASGWFTITVLSATSFTYTQAGTAGANGIPVTLAEPISDGGTVLWTKVYVSAVKAECVVSLKNMTASAVGGDGFSIVASTGDGNNANGWRWELLSANNCLGWGFYTAGADANAGGAYDCFAIVNGWGGYLDNSFLGNTYVNCGCENNGLGKISPGIGPGIVVPISQPNNTTTFYSPYLESGSRGLINGRATADGGIHPDGIYGTGSVRGWDRWNSVYFLNDANDDGSGASCYLRLAKRASSTEILSYNFSINTGGLVGSYSQSLKYGAVNGGGASWVSWGAPIRTHLAHSIESTIDTDRGSENITSGHTWIPNYLYRGASVGLNIRETVKSSGPPTTQTWVRSDRCIEVSPQVYGAFDYICMTAGTPGTWAPTSVFVNQTTAASVAQTIYASYLGVTSVAADRTITLAQGGYEGLELTIKDESGTAGTNGFVIIVTPGGAETIDGAATSKIIATPGGSLRLKRRGTGWMSLTDNKQPQSVTPKTSATALSSDDRGRFFHNTGASAQVVFTLPASPAIGDNYEFYVTDVDGIRVLAQGSHQIRVNATLSAAAGYTESATIGSNIKVMYLSSNLWVGLSPSGTWTTV